jgi:hypothetical protein
MLPFGATPQVKMNVPGIPEVATMQRMEKIE